MSRLNLRQIPRISYYEPEEPSFDEYLFCSECGDYVYDYCSIHGPLLVVPDNKVPKKTKLPSYVPRAALTIPNVFLHLAPSIIPGAGLGVFATLTLPAGVRFGPYRGEITKEIVSMYCWQIYDENNKPKHVVDAADGDRSNWMRYVNCSRNWNEQNLLAYQYKGQVYYRTIKRVPRFTELLVFYGSEFASYLNVDLRLYNSPPKIHGASTKYIFECDGCNKKFSTKDILAKHISYCHKTQKKLDTTAVRTQVEQTPVPQLTEIFNCDICEFKTSQKRRILAHLKAHVAKQVYCCNNCDYKCITNSNLQNHMKIHTGEKPFSCNICEYKCIQKSSLQKHMKIHTGEKPFSCNICVYKCITKSDLQRHMKIHTGEKPFSCHICKYQCIQKSNLQSHMKIHTGEKPFSCNICVYKCITKSDLQRHMKIHTGEKPFSCHICKYQCIQKSNLQSHMKIHTGEKPFSCHICKYQCIRKSNLKTHMKRHTRAEPFS
ncbi:unnamed protein product [Parnassius mnemosyne]|uniref:Protein hunchback n=1 Tax=Parnassius mnemosyne TaxID=213953 RepID=A0AAV1L9B3_9NEOP